MKSAGKSGHRGKGRITLDDVARQVGVSAITVSRALNNPDKVSDTLRERIQQAVLETGYVPNRAARSLASNASKTLAVIIPSVSNAVFSNVIKGIYDVCTPLNYEMIIGNTYYSLKQESNLIEKFLTHMPDGFITTGLDMSDDTRERLVQSGIPVVQMMETGTREPIDMCVGISHLAAGREMAEYFIRKGYQRIGVIASQLDQRTRNRVQGFLSYVREHAPTQPDRVIADPRPSSVHLGGVLFSELLAQFPDTDAIFCCNDDLAYGAIYECQRRHLRIPQQIAIAGFNDLEQSACINPSLTSIAIPLYSIGKTAAEMMLNRLKGQPTPTPVMDLGFRLIERESA
ncbi:transcriptional regulator [Nitrincola tibetensis]|uniref:Transcriptional regulator n=1 Tax=Nitrincola tibetensis TaxID=2219697 RepID=A0A364NRZ9_9GAMM|nr:LacI family DNA-binding transcriptional regulator [Nitrincola tibetensis]RAU19824.1 transcriptional regulator [Nitrincola tibetensis]